MNLASSPLLRRLPVAAGVLLAGVLVASPAQAASERAERLRADRPGAERALRQATTLAAGVGDGHDLTPALATLYGRRAALSASDDLCGVPAKVPAPEQSATDWCGVPDKGAAALAPPESPHESNARLFAAWELDAAMSNRAEGILIP